ncbi:MAG: histidine kinase [Chitinophagaceae bacterium]|nr:histidine kinase [Chitinophagaceae bacterium]
MDPSEKAIYSAFLIALGIVGVALLFFLVSIIRQQRRFRLLAKAKINAEISTLEKERKRIAGDLHDEIGPLLSAVKLQITHLESSDAHQKKLIDKSSQYIDDVIRRMREISNDLLPSILVRRGLSVAIEDFLNKIKAGTQTQIEYQFEIEERLPLEMEINIFRIVQEITHNMLKHSNARKFKLELGVKEGKLRLSTADDGVGFTEDVKWKKESGLGLLNLQSRTEVLGGEFFVQSSPGRGTKYLFEVPIEKE